MRNVKLARAAAVVVGLLALAITAAGCGSGSSSSSSGTGGGGSIDLVAYSAAESAYTKLIPAYEKTSQGSGVKFTESYGGSGDQSRAVDAGLPASCVHFALSPDIQRPVDERSEIALAILKDRRRHRSARPIIDRPARAG